MLKAAYVRLFRNHSDTIVKLHTSSINREKWDLLTAVLLERKPVISAELTDIEKEFKEYLSAVEFERSLKSETEIKLEAEKLAMAQKKELDDIDLVAKQSTQDFIDACKDELAKFTPAKRSTDDSNTSTLKRKLDKPLVFVLNQKIGDKELYLLPQGKRNDGETLRQCADRVLKEKCGTAVKAQIFGNAPCGFYKYKYPVPVRKEGAVGAKVFIYFARYASGDVDSKKYQWLDKTELQKVLPEVYAKSVLPIVID